MQPYLKKTKEAFTSVESLEDAIRAKGATIDGEAGCNKDLLSTLPEGRRWQWWHFFAYYLTMTFPPSSNNLGAFLISMGLLWWHGVIAAVIGSTILTIAVVLNSRGATKYFIGFPVYVRVAAGIRGASVYIVVRASVATTYFATQTHYGGRLTSVSMRGIFGNGWHSIPNHLPAGAGITSRDL